VPLSVLLDQPTSLAGCQTKILFCSWNTYIQHVRPSIENEVLLLLDNQCSIWVKCWLWLMQIVLTWQSRRFCVLIIHSMSLLMAIFVCHLYIRHVSSIFLRRIYTFESYSSLFFYSLTDVPSLDFLAHKNNMGFHAPIHRAKCPFNGASRLLIFMFSHLLFGLIKGSFCKLKIRGR
jgi:hypothetical protein